MFLYILIRYAGQQVLEEEEELFGESFIEPSICISSTDSYQYNVSIDDFK